MDSVLLAHFFHPKKSARILDLGAGCGILGLLLLYRHPDSVREIVAVEYQRSLADLAERNVLANGFRDRIRIICDDYARAAALFGCESFTHVICNPPFFREGSGRESKTEEARIARHQPADFLHHLADVTAGVLKNKGQAAIIYPADMVTQLIVAFAEKNLQPKLLRFVFSYPEAEEARMGLIMFRKNGGDGCKVQSPLFLYSARNGSYTEEVAAMYTPNR